jgi:hypothetical protein
MNLGLIFSYIVAGFLMVLMVTVSFNLKTSGNELTLQGTQKQKMSEVIETITYDIPKIGYNLNALPDTLLRSVSSSHIEFYSNIDNSTDQSLELIRWEVSSDSVSSTNNPYDVLVYRIVDGDTTVINAGITSLTFNYYDELGSNTPLSIPISAVTNKSDIDDIVQLQITMESASSVSLKKSLNADSRYLKSSWSKRFSPVNLRDN